MPLGSFGVHGFIGVRIACRRFLSGSLGSLDCALGVVVVVRGCWVHWGTPWWSSRWFGESGFIEERPRFRQVSLGSLRSFCWTLGLVWFVLGRWVHWGVPWRSLERLGWLGPLGCALGVIGFVRGR